MNIGATWRAPFLAKHGTWQSPNFGIFPCFKLLRTELNCQRGGEEMQELVYNSAFFLGRTIVCGSVIPCQTINSEKLCHLPLWPAELYQTVGFGVTKASTNFVFVFASDTDNLNIPDSIVVNSSKACQFWLTLVWVRMAFGH